MELWLHTEFLILFVWNGNDGNELLKSLSIPNVLQKKKRNFPLHNSIRSVYRGHWIKIRNLWCFSEQGKRSTETNKRRKIKKQHRQQWHYRTNIWPEYLRVISNGISLCLRFSLLFSRIVIKNVFRHSFMRTHIVLKHWHHACQLEC